MTFRDHVHAAEISEVEQDLRELVFDDPSFAIRQQALLAERTRLRGLPQVPDVVRRERTGDKIGAHWQTLTTDAERRAFLLRLGMTIHAARGKTRPEDIVRYSLFGRSAALGEFISEPGWTSSDDDDELDDDTTVHLDS